MTAISTITPAMMSVILFSLGSAALSLVAGAAAGAAAAFPLLGVAVAAAVSSVLDVAPFLTAPVDGVATLTLPRAGDLDGRPATAGDLAGDLAGAGAGDLRAAGAGELDVRFVGGIGK